MTIMIVDDSSAMRTMIRSMLKPTGAAFIEVSGGDDAVRDSRRSSVDWVLMDVMMEPVNGIDAAKQIRAIDPDARILMVSQYDDADLRMAAADAGSLGYIVKKNLSQLYEWIPTTPS